MRLTALTTLLVFASAAFTAQKLHATSPFTENFTSNVSNWADGPGTNLVNFAGSGGPDASSFATTNATASGQTNGARFVLFRGQDEFNSSGHAFEGNWVTSGITHFSAYVRHDAPINLPFFVRFATASNNPGVGAEDGTVVLPNTWTQLNFDISPSEINNTLFPEGPPSFYNSVFTSVGHIQIGYTVPTGWGANLNSYNFGLDQVSINVPEPTGWLLSLGIAVPALIRRWPRIV